VKLSEIQEFSEFRGDYTGADRGGVVTDRDIDTRADGSTGVLSGVSGWACKRWHIDWSVSGVCYLACYDQATRLVCSFAIFIISNGASYHILVQCRCQNGRLHLEAAAGMHTRCWRPHIVVIYT